MLDTTPPEARDPQFRGRASTLRGTSIRPLLHRCPAPSAAPPDRADLEVRGPNPLRFHPCTPGPAPSRWQSPNGTMARAPGPHRDIRSTGVPECRPRGLFSPFSAHDHGTCDQAVSPKGLAARLHASRQKIRSVPLWYPHGSVRPSTLDLREWLGPTLAYWHSSVNRSAARRKRGSAQHLPLLSQRRLLTAGVRCPLPKIHRMTGGCAGRARRRRVWPRRHSSFSLVRATTRPLLKRSLMPRESP